MEFSRRTQRIRVSGIRRVFEAAGEDAINLGLGQPDFDTPEHVKQAAVDALRDGRASGYTSNVGIDALREAVVDYVGFDASPDEVLVTSGASEGLHVAVQALANPGDEVLVPNPGFVSYDALTKVADAEPVGVELADDMRLEPESVKEAITDDTSVFFVNSPANPTGAVQTEDEMRAFAEIADDYGVTLVSDEVYDRFVYEGEHVSPARFGENVVTVNGASKTLAATGWRLGYIVAPTEAVDEMVKVHQYAQACANASAQYGVAETLNDEKTDEAVRRMRDEFEARRDIVLEGLDEMGLECPKPRGAFYAMPRVPDGFVDACLERGVVTVPGEAFGDAGEGHARISYASSRDNIREALEVMEEAVAELV
ncbi:MAG: pyridoxal phosphate-dependent aminotransferase [Halobacteriales archaeon]|nr:pyridoxal phosphate-dependent aminotransferase [Halobacteriales archaeon]